ncbi:hypothetical protein AZO1586I_2747 [Bathymodiolus thermophilus thioautotrophic gill symbiont]|uniref:Uncharacterized protein n=1 Tax=Bathymodiolus thermophilus thioautotrophic gill symbiont TaxID=2360 RepID=A0ABN7GFA1_9GAMM|nr:hypothetical protein [Bathymodiolus thermophilus thioautotrophic gill symbiont]CAB5508472.1 hypothetical protein AZO1586I_2747 [Bathymodiolus thermophilus thioautotrophic gill symbiont]
MNSIKTVKGLLSQDFTIKAFDGIANNNKALLYQMGLDDKAITCLVKIGKSNIKLAVLAFEKAMAVKTYVDPKIIRSVLVSNSKQYEEETLINNLVTSGAGFEMIKYFIQTYTNRKHTRLRQEFGVNDAEINKNNNAVSEKLADNFFASFGHKNRTINIEDILIFSTKNNYSMNSIWRELKIFYNNTHPVTK